MRQFLSKQQVGSHASLVHLTSIFKFAWDPCSRSRKYMNVPRAEQRCASAIVGIPVSAHHPAPVLHAFLAPAPPLIVIRSSSTWYRARAQANVAVFRISATTLDVWWGPPDRGKKHGFAAFCWISAADARLRSRARNDIISSFVIIRVVIIEAR